MFKTKNKFLVTLIILACSFSLGQNIEVKTPAIKNKKNKQQNRLIEGGKYYGKDFFIIDVTARACNDLGLR